MTTGTPGSSAGGGEDGGERLEVLIAAMESKGYLPEPAQTWKDVLRNVPRRHFVPDRGWVTQGVASFSPYAIDRAARPNKWEEAVYVDAAIVAQADDGATDPASGQGQATSSLSALSGVLYNIGFLDLDDDHTVLEIGTGTGYTAALAARRVHADANGGGTVVTVEVDPELAKQAEQNLKSSGDLARGVTVVAGDGAAGWPAGAPYDRVHATCSVQRIPYAWVEQTRPGGRIVTRTGDGSDMVWSRRSMYCRTEGGWAVSPARVATCICDRSGPPSIIRPSGRPSPARTSR